MTYFKNRVAVITGAGSGIGKCLALQLAEQGARLALSDINESALAQLANELPKDCDAKTYLLDAGSKEAVFQHAQDVKRDFSQADYVFNNAGATVIGTFEHLDIDEIEWQLQINLWGVIYGCKAFLPIMREQNSGCLINISSVFGFVAFPNQSAYNMSKFAVRALTECLWQELDDSNIRAVSVHPGGIRTNIEKSGRRSRNAGPVETAFQARAESMLVTPPEECAADILRGLKKGKRRILTGKYSRVLYYLSRLLPNHYFRVTAALG
jgi:short-subunit dehydrogenase